MTNSAPIEIRLSAVDRELIRALIRACGGESPDQDAAVGAVKRLVETDPQMDSLHEKLARKASWATPVPEEEGDWLLETERREGEELDD